MDLFGEAEKNMGLFGEAEKNMGFQIEVSYDFWTRNPRFFNFDFNKILYFPSVFELKYGFVFIF